MAKKSKAKAKTKAKSSKAKNTSKKALAKKSKAKKAAAPRSPKATEVRATKRPKKTWRSPRSKMQALTRAEEMILEKMETLDENDPHYIVLEAALTFKASWVILGEKLTEVAEEKLYKEWGYSTFAKFCTEEARITTATAKKLVKSYRWIDTEAPDLIPRRVNGVVKPQRNVPDMAAISVMADARKEMEAERVPKDAYLALKQAALEGERTASELRRELKEAIPEELRVKPAVDKTRSLRRALSAAVKTIEHLKEWDGDDALLIKAEGLRDEITERLPRAAAAAA